MPTLAQKFFPKAICLGFSFGVFWGLFCSFFGFGFCLFVIVFTFGRSVVVGWGFWVFFNVNSSKPCGSLKPLQEETNKRRTDPL